MRLIMTNKNGIHDPIPSFVWNPLSRPYLPVFTFHGVEPDAFEHFLLFLKDNAYRTLRADELIEALRNPDRKKYDKAIAITFDDGRLSEWIFGYPLLKKYGFNSINFVVPKRIEDRTSVRPHATSELETNWKQKQKKEQNWWRSSLSWGELLQAEKEGVFDVQSHSLSHDEVFCGDQAMDVQRSAAYGEPLYPNFQMDEKGNPIWGAPIYKRAWKAVINQDENYLLNELRESRREIESRLHKSCFHFSPPLHSYNEQVIQLAAKVGYKGFFNGLGLHKHQPSHGLFMIKRFGGHWAEYLPGRNRKTLLSKFWTRSK
jgi:peptidoglycan/xylan/chitin deacetylase (PgdA/CDA1 family)